MVGWVIAGALLLGGVRVRIRIGGGKTRRDHEPRAEKLVLALPVPKCCSWCCPSGLFCGSMPPGYGSTCRCSGGCGHPTREQGEMWPMPAPWEGDHREQRPSDLEKKFKEAERSVRRKYMQPAPTSMAPPPDRRRE